MSGTTKAISFTGFNGEKYRLSGIPLTAKTYLERLKDTEDGETTMLMVKDGDQTLANFSSIVSFYVEDLTFETINGSKTFIP